MELDPLLKDLSEKKKIFQRSVLSLASDLKDARARLALQEESFSREISTRRDAESKAKRMEERICQLELVLAERDGQLEKSTRSVQRYVKELDDMRSQFASAKAAAEASAESARTAEAKCVILQKDLDEKNTLLKEHEDRVNKLGEHLSLLQEDLQAREESQKKLKEEIVRIEKEILLALSNPRPKDNFEVSKIVDKLALVDNVDKQLCAKDEEIVRLRDEIRLFSSHWKHKTKDLQSQLEKHQRTDQELKKKVLKLEFCLQEARNQTRKLHRMGEKRDNTLKELRDQLATQEQNGSSCGSNHKMWESCGFKIIASMSMFVLVAFARR